MNFTCPAPTGATLTFEFREWPDLSHPGSIDISHKGPCAVYLKRVSDMTTAVAAGAGWFKIWDSGYDAAASQWCTEKLIANNGLLSVALPPGLPAGYYLVRPELLALHEAEVGDPQFYVGCAQVFVQGDEGGTVEVPAADVATIPGYVKAGDPSVSFNIYDPVFPYPMPGPPVYIPTASPSSPSRKRALAQTEGVIPADCLVKNANWCGVEVPSYVDEAGCWATSQDCYDQEAVCYGSAPPSGSANCDIWDAKCAAIQAACGAGQFNGPPDVGQKLDQVEAPVPGPIPPAENGGGGSSSGGLAGAEVPSTSSAEGEAGTSSILVPTTAAPISPFTDTSSVLSLGPSASSTGRTVPITTSSGTSTLTSTSILDISIASCTPSVSPAETTTTGANTTSVSSVAALPVAAAGVPNAVSPGMSIALVGGGVAVVLALAL